MAALGDILLGIGLAIVLLVVLNCIFRSAGPGVGEMARRRAKDTRFPPPPPPPQRADNKE